MSLEQEGLVCIASPPRLIWVEIGHLKGKLFSVSFLMAVDAVQWFSVIQVALVESKEG